MTIHTINLQYLATETFEIKIDISLTIMTEIFKFYDNATYFESGRLLERRQNRANNFRLESISTLGAEICKLLTC